MLLIIQHNVRSFRANKHALQVLYAQDNPDVLLLNGTGHKQQDTLTFSNYHVEAKTLTDEPNDGSIILIKKGIKYKNIPTTSRMHAIEVIHNHLPITIATCYMPPRYNTLPVHEYNRLLIRPNPVIIAGDFNAKHPEINTNKKDANNINNMGKSLHTFIEQHKAVHQPTTFPTYITANCQTRPDLIFTNTRFHYTLSTQQGRQNPSDHMPIHMQVDATPDTITIPPRRSFPKADWNSFREKTSHLKSFNWHHFTLKQIEEKAINWTDAVSQAAEESIPLITHKRPAHAKLSQHAKNLMEQMTHLQALMQRHPNGRRNHQRAYNIHRQNLSDELKLINQKYYNNMLTKALDKKNPKAFWSTIKAFQGKKSKRPATLIDENGTPITTQDAKDNAFREHFQKQFKIDPIDNEAFNQEFETLINLRHRTHIRQHPPPQTAEPANLHIHNLTHPITFEEFEINLQRMSNKAPGKSQINKSILQQCTRETKDNLISIYNAMMAAAYMPAHLKHAILIPIPKPNKDCTPKNHRPISLLEFHAKLYERILHNRIMPELESQNIFSNAQHGFRPHRGTETALALCYERLTRLRGIRGTAMCLRDVSGAFDKVWHTGLKVKLQHLNIPVIWQHILSQYLDNRSAAVKINQHIGRPFPLLSGVPQGAILSPMLYNIFLHDLPSPPQRFPTTKTYNYIYADDITQLISTRPTPNDTKAEIVFQTEYLNKFEYDWKIKTNISKFNIIGFRSHTPRQIQLQGVNEPIQTSNEATFLGMLINKSSGINAQIDANVAAAKLILNSLYQFKCLPTKIKLNLYKALVRPRLTYPSVILSATQTTAKIGEMQVIQNKALKFATNTKWDQFRNSRSLHEECEIEPINVFMKRVAEKTWAKIEVMYPDEYNELNIPLNAYMHPKFPRSLIRSQNPVVPQYVKVPPRPPP